MFTKKVARILSLLMVMLIITTGLAEEIAVAEEPSAQKTEAVADDKAAIKEAQQKLIDLGYLSGRADGIIGPMTTAAIKAFQERYELTRSGKLDQVTLEKLEEVARNRGSVREVQQRLIDLGFLQGKADGIYGERSRAALKLFQQFSGLEATGEPDDGTCIALFSDTAPTLPKSLGSGDSGDGVVSLQRKLSLYGFMEGEADGSYGKQTTAAVKRFQQHLIEQGIGTDMGISPSGEATSMTQYYLFGDDYSTYLRDIAPGEADSEALRVETRLVTLGYMDMPADDILDEYAIQALEAFRADVGITSGGNVDRHTMDMLFSEQASTASHFVPHAVVLGDSGLAVSEIENALLVGGMTTKLPNGVFDSSIQSAIGRVHEILTDHSDPEADLFSDAAALSVRAQQVLLERLQRTGSIGKRSNKTDISRLQRRLYSLYYIPTSGIDGLWGSNTTDAIRKFQQANGLEVTGSADEATVKLLFSAEAKANPLPYLVEVSIDDQRVYIHQLNAQGTYDLIRTCICSTGLNDSTPRGVFLDGFPVNRWHYFKKFNCWAQYSFEVEGGIMFHSVIYSSNNESSLRQNSVYALGGKASHGCIRLKVEDAKWLFEHCKRGSLAIIIH